MGVVWCSLCVSMRGSVECVLVCVVFVMVCVREWVENCFCVCGCSCLSVWCLCVCVGVCFWVVSVGVCVCAVECVGGFVGETVCVGVCLCICVCAVVVGTGMCLCFLYLFGCFFVC